MFAVGFLAVLSEFVLYFALWVVMFGVCFVVVTCLLVLVMVVWDVGFYMICGFAGWYIDFSCCCF